MSVGGARRFARLRQSLLGRRYWQRYRFTSGNEVKLLRSGDEFFTALIERIDAAQSDVALETYIFCGDSAGQAVSAALLRAASRGVKVRVITDGIGTERLPMFNEWPLAGIGTASNRTSRRRIETMGPTFSTGRRTSPSLRPLAA